MVLKIHEITRPFFVSKLTIVGTTTMYYCLPDKKNLSRLGFHKRISSIFYIIINSKFNKHYKYNITKWIKLSVCISEVGTMD